MRAMQTFLPYADFPRSAAVLDDRRLGKQRVEALQILRALVRPQYGWKHHPAVRMWAGHEEALATYGAAICADWVGRGRVDTCATTMLVDAAASGVGTGRDQQQLAAAGLLPTWLGDPAFHRSHRAALVRKDADFYGAHFPGVDPDLPYVWPGRPALP